MIPPPAVPRRLVYLGTPEPAVRPLGALHQAGFHISLVVTGADKRRGRRGVAEPSPVKAVALERGIPVSDDVDDALDVGAELGVVVAFGQIIRPHVLDRLAMVNLHFSLLPRWRGAAPVERALLAGDQATGVCLMEVAEGLDTGGIYRCDEVEILPDDTLESLRRRLVEVGARQLVDALSDGLGAAQPQLGDPVYAEKITTADLEIDWATPAVAIDRIVRLGGAFTTFRGARLKIWAATVTSSKLPPGAVEGSEVGTAEGGLLLETVQPEGRGRMDAASWLHGVRLQPGERFGT